jgi:hypothetical protein
MVRAEHTLHEEKHMYATDHNAIPPLQRARIEGTKKQRRGPEPRPTGEEQ